MVHTALLPSSTPFPQLTKEKKTGEWSMRGGGGGGGRDNTLA